MNTLKDYVNFRLTHADKIAEAEGYPISLENCKKYKPMRDLKIYGNSVQDGTPSPENPIEVQSVGELVTDETDSNYGKYKIPVTVHGKNLASAYDVCKNLASYKETTLDGRECVSYASNYGYKYNNYPFKENTQYTISFYVKSVKNDPLTGFNMVMGFTYTDGSAPAANHGDAVYAYNDGVNDIEWRKVTITSIAGKTVKAIGTDGNHYTLTHHIDVNTFQIEEGAAATEYEPYVEPVTTNIFLDEPLRKLGDYADYIDFKNNRLVRKCVKKYLKDCAWNNGVGEYGGNYNFTAIDHSIIPHYYNPIGLGNSELGKSNIFPVYASGNQEKYSFAILMSSWISNVQIMIPPEYLSEKSISAFMDWLGEYNPYMIRVLATPTEEPLNIELPKSTAKTTIIEIDTSLLPSNASGKYIKR